MVLFHCTIGIISEKLWFCFNFLFGLIGAFIRFGHINVAIIIHIYKTLYIDMRNKLQGGNLIKYYGNAWVR